jgi:hypothetical protein
MWMSSVPTSIGAMPSILSSRCCELSQAVAASVLVKRCRITQSTCAGGLGGITVCWMKPRNLATIVLVSSCQRANASLASGRTRVCVTIVTPWPAVDPPPAARSIPLMAIPPAWSRCGPA